MYYIIFDPTLIFLFIVVYVYEVFNFILGWFIVCGVSCKMDVFI